MDCLECYNNFRDDEKIDEENIVFAMPCIDVVGISEMPMCIVVGCRNKYKIVYNLESYLEEEYINFTHFLGECSNVLTKDLRQLLDEYCPSYDVSILYDAYKESMRLYIMHKADMVKKKNN